MTMLKVENLSIHYGVIQAVNDVSFEVNQGEVVINWSQWYRKDINFEDNFWFSKTKSGFYFFYGETYT